MKNETLNVVISAYACGPNWGSEIGMGWHWVINMSQYCKLHIVTEKGFQDDIESKLSSLNLNNEPKFYYNDIGEKARTLFWKQGSFLFYKYYKDWQLKTLSIVENIITKENIDLIHQLNMIGFREPGYLWKIPEIPIIWGPIGGFNQMPMSYLLNNNVKNILFYGVKNLINFYQKKYLLRVKKSAKRANLLIAATKEAKTEIELISGKSAYLMGETGCDFDINNNVNLRNFKETLKILWVGRLQSMKALPIALKALSRVKEDIKFEFTIIGDGPDEKHCRKIAKKLKVDKHCRWLGRITNDQVIEEMRLSSILFFTSLKEGSPHVVSEAIQNGLPVLCHDACGHGITIDETCGIKIPMIDAKTSEKLFSESLLAIYKNFNFLKKLSKGAIKRSSELTWQSKALEMLELYHKVI